MSRREEETLALGGLAAVLTVLCAVTWQKWGTVVVDCGREMYVPAALAHGKRLYFDIWYPYGPLIPYWHALWFRILGAHLWVLEAAGIAVVAITTCLLYSLARTFLPAALAFTAGFAFLLQAFELTDPGGFNYVLPYSYPAAYAAMLFVAFAWLLARDAIVPRPWTFWAAGTIAGLEILVKLEFGVAAYLVLGAAIAVRAVRSGSAWTLAKCAVPCLPGMLLAAGIYGWYVRAGGLDLIFGENIAVLPNAYFTRFMGTHWAYVTGSEAGWVTILVWVIRGLLGLALLAAAVRTAGRSRAGGRLVSAAVLAICCLYLAVTFGNFGSPLVRLAILNAAPLLFFNRGMALVSGLLLLWTLLQWRRHGLDARGWALALMLTAGIAMDWRTTFKTQPYGYSIFYDVLVFTGYLVAVRRLIHAIHVPESPRLWAWSSTVMCCGLLSMVAVDYYGIFTRTFPVASAAGRMYEDPWTGRAFAQTLEFLNRSRIGSSQFVVWPEEMALYYFAGATAPSRWLSLMPGILPPGETSRRFLEELDRRQVKYVVLSDRAAPEYGVPVFGIDYNQEPYLWLVSHFHVIRTFGNFQRRENPEHWAVQIWERDQPAVTASR